MAMITGFLLIACILFNLFGILIFLKGFFPIKSSFSDHSNINDSCFNLEPECCVEDENHDNRCFVPPSFGKLIFVLIDALRADFVLPDHRITFGQPQRSMPFVQKLLSMNETMSFSARSQPPTVTLPRVKAIVTGTIPGFIDVVLNFDSSSLLEDNIISQMRQQNRRLVFYGDDTWLRLFPELFARHDGTTSFFVSDYTEVDRNVTRHLDEDLRADDWDTLILHYLGLDHIGHLAGPSSPLIGPKLKEMDDVVEKLLSYVESKDIESGRLPSLLVLCGDHGMSDQGSHGGSTPSETITPLLFMSSRYRDGKGASYSSQEVQQIDIAPTLSVLLGFPIPKNSLGVIIFDSLNGLGIEDKLKAAYLNGRQLTTLLKENSNDYNLELGYQEIERAFHMHSDWLNSSTTSELLGHKVLNQYMKALRMLSDKLAGSLTNYDLHAMGSGIAICLVVFLIFLSHMFLQASVGGQFSMLTPWGVGTWIVVIASIILLTLIQITICTSHHGSSLLCTGFLAVPLVIVASISVTLLVCSIGTVLRHWNSRQLKQNYFQMSVSERILSWTLWLGSLIHSISLLSSSFVEEEHQTWYFLTITVHILLTMCIVIDKQTKQKMDVSMPDEMNILMPDKMDVSMPDRKDISMPGCALRESTAHARLRNKGSSTLSNLNYKNESSETRSGSNISCSVMACLVGVSVCRFARMWNQTGDKWSHLPDIGDMLVRPENKSLLSFIVVLSLVALCCATVICACHQKFVGFVFICGSATVYFFNAARSLVVSPLQLYEGPTSQGISEARIVYTLILLVTCYSMFCLFACSSRHSKLPSGSDYEKRSVFGGMNLTNFVLAVRSDINPISEFWRSLHIVWTLFMLLVTRCHNITLILFMTLQCLCLRVIVKQLGLKRASLLTLLYLWMGQASFYYQGNSNSLSTINIAAGYVGLSDYQPVLIGALMCLNSYSGPVFWTLALMEVLADGHYNINSSMNGYLSAVWEFCLTSLLSRSLVIVPYLILVSVQRYHLFVWTVFSPKLLYEAMFLIVTSGMTLLVLVMTSFINRCLS